MQESPIFSKTYDLLLWLMPATTKFPREQRFVLARSVQETALRFQECLIEAGVGHGRSRSSALTRADVQLTKLRFYLRLCQDMKLLKLNQYQHVAAMVAEVGRLLGGWRKSVSQTG
jgi:cytosine/adenosine deaminase-related metal-dependent hydrolase